MSYLSIILSYIDKILQYLPVIVSYTDTVLHYLPFYNAYMLWVLMDNSNDGRKHRK